MQIIIIGAGNVGRALAKSLIAQEEEVAVISRDQTDLDSLDDYDCRLIQGIPIDRGVLERAGIETADLVLLVSESDNMNLMASQIAKEVYHVPRVITLLRSISKQDLYAQFGFECFSSTELSVNEILKSINDTKTAMEQRFYNSTFHYTLLNVDEELHGIKLEDLESLSSQRLIGIVRDQGFLLFDPELKLEAGDQIVLLSAL
ncbi:MAG: TrkA family potassium uptake protein [Eubacteriales bacterium]|nr:TrkA family potassium uptake protein [Eubacteriales bacterium]